MTNHPQQPGKYDAVLGGQNQTSEFAAVLGGIEGVKLRLSNPDPQVRIASLQQALNYGEMGLDLVIRALNDESKEVKNVAYGLLETRIEAKVKEALIIFEDAQLKSAVGMDYRTLRDLLKAGKWEEADEETARVMLAVAKREKEGSFGIKDIDNFPCTDLRTIDQLWVKYSDGKFGFSVQKRIYQGLGGTREYNQEIWKKFGDKVGWRKGGNWLYYDEITFDKKAPEGYVPRWLWMCKWGVWVGSSSRFLWVSSLASRLVNCNI
ncbi:GUN4 domain-containing protein [Sphaerospermopsis sp. LEGE 08334]|jgi:hypothetical protein|uniref:GUN4 domain-containing protein n=1 Tax=Sphaerospermopsis sp. LEGE 08334 TaxID=1828651 RepID=UPI001882C005|nr:GUN4 domain-containing protein [Sphaerospermopsis sp. LEGE 08334]